MNSSPSPAAKPKKENVVLAVLLLLAIIGAAAYYCFEARVFPTASLDLKLSRGEIAKLSDGFARRLGYNLPSTDKRLIKSTTFTTFDESKTFLEYELGLAKAQQYIKETVPVWSWATRYCREYTIEQFTVWLSPAGELLAFSRTFEEERPMPSLKHTEARALAAKFIAEYGHADINKLKAVSDEESARLKRVDHTFIFEDPSFEIKGAHMRYLVEISGDCVTAYNHFLVVPDAWTRKYEHIRTYNDQLQGIASIFYGTLQIIASLIVPWAIMRKQMRWRFALFGGAIMALTGLLDLGNEYNELVSAYDPLSSFSDYLFSVYGRQGAAAIGSFITGTLLFGGGDVVYRLAYPNFIALENYAKLKGFATSEGLKGVLVGHLVFAVHMGWLILYYMLGEKLNFWCPLGVDNYQVLSAAVPFYSAISLGIHAAGQEETIARVVALALFQKVTGRFWLANLFQAASWAFMHSSYAQQPAYARGVELTICGMFYGFILRRYGVLPCFIGHYLVDAFLDAKCLFSAGSQPTLFASGFLAVLPFMVTGIAAYFIWRFRKTESKEAELSLTNGALPASEMPPPHHVSEAEVYIYQPMPGRKRKILALVSFISLTFFFFFRLPTPGDAYLPLIDKEAAVKKAKIILKDAGIDPSLYNVVPSLGSNLAAEELQYVFEKVGLQKTMELARITQPGLVWQVRFFRFMDPTEYEVQLLSDGRQYSFTITEQDDAPGANLKEAEASKLALSFIERLHPEYKDFKPARSSWDKEKNRTDYNLDYLVPALKVGEAEYKFHLQVVGDQPCNFSQAWQIPSSWTFERNKQKQMDVMLVNLRSYSSYICILLGIWWAIGLLRSGVIGVRIPAFVAALCAVITVLEQLNHLPSLYAGYETHVAPSTYVFNHFVDIAQHAIQVFFKTFLSLAFALGVFKLISPRTSLGAILSTAFRPTGVEDRLSQKEMWIDGIIIAVVAEALNQFRLFVFDIASYYLSSEVHTAQPYYLCSLSDYFSPVISDLLEMPQSFAQSTAMFLIGAGLYAKYCPNFKIYMVFCTVYALIGKSDARHLVDYVIDVLSAVSYSAIVWYFLTRLAKYNPVAYLVKIVMDDSLIFLYSIYIAGLPGLTPQLLSFILYLMAPLAVVLYFHLRNKAMLKKY